MNGKNNWAAKLVKFGKPVAPMLGIKRNFFEDNNEMLAWQKEMADFYLKQPRRHHCMTCTCALGPTSFEKLGVPYIVCAICGHLNGGHRDTDEFVERVYTSTEGSYYAAHYASTDSESYRTRVSAIYDPKAEFLIEGLVADGVTDPKGLTYCDLGSGSGYFLQALLNIGISEPRGLEVSKAQVAYSNMMVPGAVCREIDVRAINQVASRLDCDVLSMIGVLEHLQDPRSFLDALMKNKRPRYLLLAVPLHAPATVIEMAFPSVMQRNLSGDHTHLYTESSIQYLCREFGMRRAAEWWFGTDAMDLYRSMSVLLKNDVVEDTVRPLIDAIQLAIDRQKKSSEVHMLLSLRT